MSTTLTNSFVVKAIAALVVVATLITMTGVASVAPVSAQVVVDGSLVKTADSPDVYIVKIIGSKTFKRLILNPTIFESYGHLSWDNIITVSQSTLDSYTTSNLVIEVNPDGSAVNGKVYVLTSSDGADTGTKQHLNVTASEFEAAGLDWDSLYHINQTEAGAGFYPEGAAITDASQVPGADGGSTPTTPGLEGTLSATVNPVPSAEEVQQGDNSTAVMGFETEADNSAITIERVDVNFDVTPTGAEDRIYRYLDEVALYADGDLVAESDADSKSDYTEITANDVYQIRFSGLDVVVPKDGEIDWEIRVTPQDTIDAAWTPSTVAVTIPANGIRGQDGAGINQYNAGAVTRNFTIIDAVAGALTATLGEDSPEAGIVEVDDDTNTDDVELLVVDVEAGERDITLEQVSVNVLVDFDNDATANDDESLVAHTLHLVHDGDVIASESVPADAAGGDAFVTVTFEDFEVDIDADDTEEFTVVADLHDIQGDFIGGTTIQATWDSSTMSGFDSNDDAVTGTGTDPTGDELSLYSVAPSVELVSVSNPVKVGETTDQANASIVLDVTAVGGDIYFGNEENLPGGFTASAGTVKAISYTFSANSKATRAAGVAATLTDSGISYTAKKTGVDGNDITIALVDGADCDATAGDGACTTVVGSDIVFTADFDDAEGNAGAVALTRAMVVADVMADTDAAALITAAVTAGGNAVALAETNLATGANGTFRISEGQTAQFTVSIHLNNNGGTAGFFQPTISAITWGTSVLTAGDNTLPSGSLEDLEANPIYLST